MSTVGMREAQRIETRTRLFDVAVAEIGRSGLARADVSSIVAAAGVARGTFYFHFPTKEHILAELERNEEVRIVAKLESAGRRSNDLGALLRKLVDHVVAVEERLGPTVFRDMLSLHFSPTRPLDVELQAHPLADFVIAAVRDAQAAGEVDQDADAGELAVIFLTGLFALLSTTDAGGRIAILDRYVKTIVNGMEIR
jgi:AcrR family transcriptional regulator